MHYVKKIFKIGGSLAVGIPRIFIDNQTFAEGDIVLFEEKGRIIEITNMQDIIDNADKINKGGHNVIDR